MQVGEGGGMSLGSVCWYVLVSGVIKKKFLSTCYRSMRSYELEVYRRRICEIVVWCGMVGRPWASRKEQFLLLRGERIYLMLFFQAPGALPFLLCRCSRLSQYER